MLRPVLHLRPALAVAAWLAVLVWAPGARAVERRAGNADELRVALQAARPGDVVVMKNGVWKDVAIDFRAEATAKAPVRLRAQTPGSVILTGNSRLTFLAPHLIAEGLFFRDGTLTGAGSGGAVIRFTSHHGRLTDSAVVDYNPKGGTADGVPEYAWVHFEGDDNRVDHSSFRGKTNRRPVIANRPGARRNQVDRCHFKDIAFRAQNGREVIQIMGYGMNEELGSDGAFFTAERNLFEEAHGEAAEIISIKSNRNVIRGNTFRRTKGGITNRSGNFNVIEGNIVLGENEPGSYGIRVTGQHHRVVNNYVADVEGPGLLLVAGELYDRALTPEFLPLERAGTPLGRVPRYAQVREGVFAHNRFVNCGSPVVQVGSSYKAGWPRAQRVLLPENNRIAGNLVKPRVGPKAAALRVTEPDHVPPLDALPFAPNELEDNQLLAPEAGSQTATLAPAGKPLRPADVGARWMRDRLAAQ
jgi:poly(beta-D-mannuronate) lyase